MVIINKNLKIFKIILRLIASTQSFNSLLDNVSLEASQVFDDNNHKCDEKKTHQQPSYSAKTKMNDLSISGHIGDDDDNLNDKNENNINNEKNPLFSSRTYVKVSSTRNIIYRVLLLLQYA